MYEENLEPLPPGNLLQTFAAVFAELQKHCDLESTRTVTHEQVLFWAKTELQEYVSRISRRLLLPGSGISGTSNLEKLIELSVQGSSCILCLNHRSNLDVPTLHVLLEDASRQLLFEKLIWIAGRKLQEDAGFAGVLVQAYNRVIVTPRSWSQVEHSPDEIHEGHLINIAAHRAIHEFRHEGWVFALFPSGTRIRPGDVSTTRAVPEIDSYLKSFDYMMLGNITGCTLPVSANQDLDRETPRLGKVLFNFGEVLITETWRSEAARRYPACNQRAASARAIMQDIAVLDTR